ncbi:hypothetical protein Q5M60_12310 [Acinetobacter baumannii]|nr:hypothetical protein [Acinetobacter baumannii]
MATYIEMLDKLIDSLLSNSEITIETINDSVQKNDLIIELVTGNEKHATYVIYKQYENYSVAITKCKCGYIHYLEDLCIKCHPKETFDSPSEKILDFDDYDLPF